MDNAEKAQLRKQVDTLKEQLKAQQVDLDKAELKNSVSHDLSELRVENERLKLLIFSSQQIALSLATDKATMQSALDTLQRKFKVALD
jgi:hypothetical protein